MKRETGIPFLAWIGTAVVAHLMWSAGAERLARVVEDVTEVRWFAESVQWEFASNDVVEVTLEKVPSIEPIPEASESESELNQPNDLEESNEPEPEKQTEKQPEEPEPQEREKIKPIQIFPSKPKLIEKKPPRLVVQPKKDRRIAVKQHVEKNQKDNPNAQHIGDEANHVEKETVARITSHDQDDPNPTPGGQHISEHRNPGNADETLIAEDEDRDGDPDKAPGEHVDEPIAGNVDKPPKAPALTPPSGGSPETPRAAQKSPPPSQTEPSRKSAQGPESLTGNKGSYSLDPRRNKNPQASGSTTPTTRPLPRAPRIGLGVGPNENGIRTNLNINDVVAAVGSEKLTRARAADGERRRSKHRGSWKSNNFERWRAAIENYVSSVRPGNQTALNTARVPFATYLVRIHNRLHPVFADTFLASLDRLPFDNPINNYKLFTRLEIVVEPKTGRVIRMGVIKTSGITRFDVGALDSVQRSAPFGQAPPAIISSDGNVYLHWEFHRNPIYACSTMNARPYMLNRPPAIKGPKQPPPRQPKPPSDPRERGAPPPGQPGSRSRYGQVEPLKRPQRG